MNVFRRNLSVIISMALILSSIMTAGSTAAFVKETSKASYSDVPKTHRAYTAITELTKQNVVSGIGGGKFGVNKKVTRGQFAAFIAKGLELKTTEYEGIFADVPRDKYYAKSIEAVTNNGIASGYSDGRFHPEAHITREQMAVMIMNAYSFAASEGIKSLAGGVTLDFSDAKKISNWALTAVKAATNTGIMTAASNGSFGPKGYVTRAQAAMVIYNMLLVIPVEEFDPNPTPEGAEGILINDNERGTGLNQFEYVPERNWPRGTPSLHYRDNYGLDHTGDSKENESDYFQFRFKGTQVKIRGIKNPPSGLGAFSIDGGDETIIDLYQPAYDEASYFDNAVIYESPVLPYGEHILKCRKAGKSPSSNGESWSLFIDSAEVIGDTESDQPALAVNAYFDKEQTGTGLHQFNYYDGTPGKLNGYDTTKWVTGPGINGFNSTSHYIEKGPADSYATFKFEGTQVALYAELSPWSGKTAVSILDENGKEIVAEQVVDCYANHSYTTRVFTSGVLPFGTYILKARVTGEYNTNNEHPDGETFWTFNVCGALVSTSENVPLTDPEPKYKTYKDSEETGSGLNQFSYVNGTAGKVNDLDTTTWQAGKKWGSLFYHYIERGATDAYATFKFSGTQIGLNTTIGPDHGILACSILDENGEEVVKEQEADCYYSRFTTEDCVYVSPYLSEGTYTLKVRVTGKTNARNIGSDGQKYWKAGILGVYVAPDASVDINKELSY